MGNPFLSGRISPELHKQVEEYLARSGESKTQMLSKAVAAYIDVEIPQLKTTGNQRIENLELEVANLKDAITSLSEKFATLSPKTEEPKTESELIGATDNNIDNTDNTDESDTVNAAFNNLNSTFDNTHNHIAIEPGSATDKASDNTNNLPDIMAPTSLIDLTSTVDDNRNFIHVDTAEVAKLTKLPYKKINDSRGYINRNLKKENKALPANEILDTPIKITPQSGIKISKIAYDLFYAGQSKQGKNLWNLIPKGNSSKQLNLLENS